jgi:membrane-associated phospholipid phosphatase
MEKKELKKLILSLLFLFVCAIIAYIGVLNLYKIYPNLPILTDFLFEHTPYLNILFIADIIVTVAVISFFVFMFKKNKWKELPFYATIIGIFYLIRSALIYLTPLANPYPGVNFLPKVFPSGGMFPSGHTALIFLFFLFTLKNKAKSWNIYFIILLIIEMISMILSRGHYTIDIIGALFIAYTLWKIGDEHFKKKLILK